MLSLYLSMAAFSLASSISPGPVNITALSAGMGYGFRATLSHVVGATVGFTLLLIGIGFTVQAAGDHLPGLIAFLRWAGAAFLLYMAYRLWGDSGQISASERGNRPSAWTGALMQWLNPKAWMASAAGMGLFAAEGSSARVLVFAAIFFSLCLFSIACWAYAGAFLGRLVRDAGRVRLLNRGLAVLLAVSAMALLV
jgi:threonine/homoserine/homoserine lactone efflux protein